MKELCGICHKPLVNESWTDDDQYGDVHERCLEAKERIWNLTIESLSKSNSERKREQKLADAQIMLGWFAAHPEIPLPHEMLYGEVNIYAFNTKEEATVIARAMGTFDKNADGNFLRLKKKFGSITVSAVFNRNEVCERIVTGVQEIPETVIPARTEPARTIEIVEWRCPTLLDSSSHERES